MDPEPEFEVKMLAGRQIVICTIGEYIGAARVFSTGEAEARQRAQAQAQDKKTKAEQE